MDLHDFAPKSDFVTVILKNPNTDEPLTNEDGSEMSVEYWLSHSKVAQDLSYELADERIVDGKTKTTRKDLVEFANETFYGSIKSWDITWKGEKPEYDPEIAREVFSKLPALKTQIQTEANRQSGFMEA